VLFWGGGRTRRGIPSSVGNQIEIKGDCGVSTGGDENAKRS